MATATGLQEFLEPLKDKNWKRIEITNCQLVTQPDNSQWVRGACSWTMEEEEGGVKLRGLKLTQEEFCILLDQMFERESDELIISNVDLSETVCQHIGKRLESADCKLNSLGLTYCKLKDCALKFIANALKVNESLKALDLSDNVISKDGALHLYETLPHEPRLKSLDLSDNPCKGQGIRLLEKTIDDFVYTITEQD